MKAAMGRLMAGVSRLMSGLGGTMGKWIQAPGQMVMIAGKQVWQAGAWTLDKAADIGEYCMEAVDTAVGVTAQAAIHVGQDIGKGAMFTARAAKHVGQDVAAGAGIATRTAGKVAWNNPVSLFARNVGRYMTGDHRPVINPDKASKAAADKSVKSAKDMNPAELAKVKAEWVKNDPDLVREFAAAESSEAREAALAKMSPKARDWVSTLTPTDIWTVKRSSAVEIAAHMAGDSAISGLSKVESYYGATRAIAAAPEPEVAKDKTVTERRAERTAKKLAKRDAANGVTPEVTGTVPGQSPQQDQTAQQQVINFFGPKVAKEDEVSPYAQASLPTYRPPVPMRRPAMA
ncbi:hypothetical protein G6L68_25395 [Agrobacterium fabrum]|uniref:hypothetical protein n=1 Tax=Agrobacterium fabrum TaxID=1176649 RepID=UPI000EF5DD67|nr:hypothetical protein [Agrobacterium fabrum]AYM66123.1 hypothetical protein At12D13_49710 [Agrobacterium fabrum]NTE63970.1 hypothetical protein [Agrobacterium fabrum]